MYTKLKRIVKKQKFSNLDSFESFFFTIYYIDVIRILLRISFCNLF